MILPSNKADFLAKVLEIKDVCRASASRRASLCRLQHHWIQTGRASGQRSLVNLLYSHIDRLASHLFSPVELRFVLDFEAHYPKETLSQGETAARSLTREWEHKAMDIAFASAVELSLQYGSAIFKQVWGHDGVEGHVVMPWQFGVYREDINNIEDQEAVCESGLMTLPEVWRRISHLPNAESMYRNITDSASEDAAATQGGNSFFHNVLSSSILNTDSNNQSQRSGGVVDLSGGGTILSSGSAAKLIPYHEMYIKDDERGDYVTVLLIEPDIIVSPYFKRANLFAPKEQPYTLVQANLVPGDFWGRSEIVDLVESQGLLSTWMDDVKRLMGMQFDKLLAFTGAEGITDEKYGEFRSSGYIDMPAGASVNDLTPPLPAQAFTAIEMLKRFMDEVSGFGNILSGQGEPG